MLAALALLLAPTTAEDSQCLLQRSAQQRLVTASTQLGQTFSELWVLGEDHPTYSKWLVFVGSKISCMNSISDILTNWGLLRQACYGTSLYVG